MSALKRFEKIKPFCDTVFLIDEIFLDPLGKPQNQVEADKKHIYERWLLENKAWLVLKISSLKDNLQKMNAKLETVTQKERDVRIFRERWVKMGALI